MPIKNKFIVSIFLFFNYFQIFFVFCMLKTDSVSFTKTRNQPHIIFISNFNKFELSNPSAIHLQFTTLMSGLNSSLKWRLNSIAHVRRQQHQRPSLPCPRIKVLTKKETTINKNINARLRQNCKLFIQK